MQSIRLKGTTQTINISIEGKGMLFISGSSLSSKIDGKWWAITGSKDGGEYVFRLSGSSSSTIITALNCTGCNLTSIAFQECLNLKILDCGANKFTQLDLTGLPALEELFSSFNKNLASLNVSGLNKLKHLQLNNCNMSGASFNSLFNALNSTPPPTSGVKFKIMYIAANPGTKQWTAASLKGAIDKQWSVDDMYIIKQPENKTVAENQEATFEVLATNKVTSEGVATSPTYQWMKKDPSGTLSNISTSTTSADYSTYEGANTKQLKIKSASPALHGYQFQCVVKNGNTVVDKSNIVTLNVLSPPTVTIAPGSQNAIEDDKIEFTVTATKGKTDTTPSTPLTYQWQIVTINKGLNVYTDIPNATNNKYTIAKAKETTKFRCVVKHGPASTNSKEVTLTVTRKSGITFTTNIFNQTITVTGTSKIDVNDISGVPAPTGKWQYFPNNGQSWIDLVGTNGNIADVATFTIWTPTTSSTRSTLYVTPTKISMSSYKFRCKLENSTETKYSDEFNFTVNPRPPWIEPKDKNLPEDISVVEGNNATFKVQFSGDTTLTYKWRCYAPGNSTPIDLTNGENTFNKNTPTSFTVTITNATTHTLTVQTKDTKMNGYKFECAVKNSNGIGEEVYSAQKAKLTVTPKPVAPKLDSQYPKSLQGEINGIQIGKEGIFEVKVLEGSEPLIYQWEISVSMDNNGRPEWKKLTEGGCFSGTKTKQLKISNAYSTLNNAQFQCIVISDNDGVREIPATSKIADLTIISPPRVSESKGLQFDLYSKLKFLGPQTEEELKKRVLNKGLANPDRILKEELLAAKEYFEDLAKKDPDGNIKIESSNKTEIQNSAKKTVIQKVKKSKKNSRS